MKQALRNIKAAVLSLLAFMVSAALWILILFIGGACAIVAGVKLMFGLGPALIAAGVAMLCACVLLKRAVING